MSAWQHGSSLEDSGHCRVETVALFGWLREIDLGSENWESQLTAASSGIVDLLLQADVEALASVTDPLRDLLAALDDQTHALEVRGWLLALLSVTRWALQRLPSVGELQLARDGMTWRFLHALEPGLPRSSSDLRTRLETGAPQISRVGRELLGRGLVIQRRTGREAIWELTPRGRQLVRDSERQAGAPPWGASGPSHEMSISSNGSAGGSRVSAARPSSSRAHRPSAADGGRDVRHVLPAEEGGWRVAKAPDARTIELKGTQREAVDRAREILKRSGGGTISVHARNGDSVRDIDIGPH
jgi:DNA-binding MarR family transcriptional regulator